MFGRRRGRRGSLGRPAVAGERCTCGAAAVVFDDWRIGPAFGSCLDEVAHERTGPCPFCGVPGPHLTGGVCPSYTLRPAWATEPARKAMTNVEGANAA